MFVPTDLVTGAVIVLLCAFSLCKANVQSSSVTQYTKGKTVATSYMTLQPYSKIQCVVKCVDEKRQNRCSIAGYNVVTKTCLLSNDNQTDLLDTADDAFGVFFYSAPGGMFSFTIPSVGYARLFSTFIEFTPFICYISAVRPHIQRVEVYQY